jgi:hypothetical protein
MQQLIADVAKHTGAGLFRRFDIMRHWQREPGPAGAPVIGADGLHMTDRSYGCLAAALAEAITRNWRRYEAETPAARIARYASASPAGDLAGDDAP